MKYYIRSNKWTKNDKVETWWKANECGYTILIARAGVYSEEDKARIEKFHNKFECEFIPITQDLWNKGMKQLEKKDRGFAKERIDIIERCSRELAEVQREQDKNATGFEIMKFFAKELGH